MNLKKIYNKKTHKQSYYYDENNCITYTDNYISWLERLLEEACDLSDRFKTSLIGEIK